MNEPLRLQAQALRIGLQAGIVTVPDVVFWADRCIEAETTPDPLLFELSLSSGRMRDDIDRFLEQLGGPADEIAATRRVIALLLDRLDTDPSRGLEIARSVVNLRRRGHLPESIFGDEPFYIDEYFDEATYVLDPGVTAIGTLRAYLQREASKP